MPGSLFIKIAALPFFIWAFVLTSDCPRRGA